MNFYQMDLKELDRIGRDADLDDYTKAILEKGLSALADLEVLKRENKILDDLTDYQYDELERLKNG
jgi:hypothetical protein